MGNNHDMTNPPDRLTSPDGSVGWFAFNPDGSHIGDSDDAWRPPAEGSVIRLMGEHSVTVPLWDDEGLMFGEPDELVRELGVSPALAADLAAWADAWHTASRQPGHDAEAAQLVRRLDDELDHRYRIVFHR